MWRYLQAFVLTAGLGLGFSVSFNALMDPLALLGSPAVPGLNAHKTTIGESGERRYKAEQIRRVKPEVLILGTSRVQVGIPGDHPAFGGLRVFNAGLSGTNMVEIERVFAFALAHSRPKEILLGLDFLAFGKRRSVAADFEDSGFAQLPDAGSFNRWRLKVRYLVSINTLGLSWRTLLDNLQGKPERYDVSGADNYLDQLPAPDYRALFDADLRGMLSNIETYAGYSYDPERMQLLWKTAEICAQEGIGLHLFINPIHARQLEVLRALGLDEAYRRWVRALVDGMEKLRGKYPNAQVVLWDFGGYHDYAIEAPPPAGKVVGSMRWYWESSHFKRRLGALLLDRLYGRSGSRAIGAEFGVVLNSAQIEGRLALFESRRAEYASRQPDEVRAVECMVARTRRIWGALCADCSRRGIDGPVLTERLCVE